MADSLKKICPRHPELFGQRDRWGCGRCPACDKESAKRFREKHAQRMALKTKKWRNENHDRARAHEKQNWAARYSLICGQKLAKRYAKEIRKIYLSCPEGHHVDHIVPLRGKLVNGLHVPWNLQYLPAHENQRKGNRYGGIY